MDGANIASNIKYYTDYAKYIEEEGRVETWEDSVARVMNMHRGKYATQILQYPELARAIDFAEEAYLNKEILGSMRALQWGGEALRKHEAKMYNCLSSYVDRVHFFQECMYFLLCGCGTGFSVQNHHIEKLPPITNRTKGKKTFTIPDSIEGWSDAVGALISSYISPLFKHEATFREFVGYEVKFDYSLIRPKGSKISGGFKAPGPEGLRKALNNIVTLLDTYLYGYDHQHISPIIAYDIVMFFCDAVLSGGVRRSATICLFSPDDEEMLQAKTGDWMDKHPQRARSNNSAVLVKSEVTEAQFNSLFQSVKQFGEPGFIFVDDEDIAYNPCVEIGMWPQTERGVSGWQGCNLTTINGSLCNSAYKFYEACRASAIMGTLQAGYTDLKYVGDETIEIFEREALLGCSVTGWCNNPEVLLDTDVQQEGAEIVKGTNKIIAKMLGINQAARTTCVKPEGNSSVFLKSASGIHGEHAPRYFRNMQMNKGNDVSKLFAALNPVAVEESVWNKSGSDWIFSLPVVAPKNSLFKRHLTGVNQLELVRLTQNNWVEYGTNEDLCVNPIVRHNVSNTVQVIDWDEIRDYIYKYRKDFAGISLIGVTGDKDYAQAPFTEVFTKEQLLDFYGDAALFASGLIVDGMHVFNDDLWWACRIASGDFNNEPVERKDWCRRAVKFSDNYFGGDMGAMTYCLKDIYNYHKWCKITRNLVEVDWSDVKPDYIDVDTLASAACIGGVCEI